MNKLLKKYKSLVVFVTIIVILLIVGVCKDKKEQEIIYKNCINYADGYMKDAMKDFNDIYGGYSYLIKEDSFTKTNNAYCLDVEIREDNKTLDTLNFKFDDKVNDTLWLPDYEKPDNKIENLLEIEKRKT